MQGKSAAPASRLACASLCARAFALVLALVLARPAPVSAEEAASADPEPEPRAPLPFRNSLFTFDQALGASTFFRGAQQSYDPYYAWSFTLRPRYYLSDELFVSLTQGLSVELTDTEGAYRFRDVATRNRQPVLSDTLVDLTYGPLEAATLGSSTLSLSPGLRLALPLSKPSRAQDLYFGVGPTLAARLPIASVLEGLLLGVNARYQHNFHGSNVALRESDAAVSCAAIEPAHTACGSTGGFSSASDAVVVTTLASLSPLPDMTLDLSFSLLAFFGRSLATAVVPVDSAEGGTIELADESRTHDRLYTLFSIGSSYNLLPWLNLALGLSTWSSGRAADGSRDAPFFDVYDSTVNLTATVVLDRFYTSYVDAEDAEQTPVNPRNQVQSEPKLVAF